MGNWEYKIDQFADLAILRYQVPGFETLPLRKKLLIYHLSEAALMGRDILFDQNGRYNLAIRKALETIYTDYTGDKEDPMFKALETYLKRVWFSNGIHHHYALDKFSPDFTPEFFQTCIRQIDPRKLPLREGQNVDQWVEEILPVIFDPDIMPKRSVQSGNRDWIKASSNHYYEGDLTQKEVEHFYASLKKTGDTAHPKSYGLNSRLVKDVNGQIYERTWRMGGLYSTAIEQIVKQLKLALPFTENKTQQAILERLIDYYQTGDLQTFDEYSILWVKDTESEVDFVNGFIETYGDPLGLKASWEAIVDFINEEATQRTKTISDNAQWFEDHSPIDNRFKKKKVKGVSAKAITVAMLGGDCYPSTPIGINLPNADWIRRDHGSKSVSIENITDAYNLSAQGNGFKEEFVWDETERERMTRYGVLTDKLHTDLHECLGHGSGQLLEGVDPNALKAYSSTLEEARADLFGLYYLADPKLVELGLLPDSEAYKAAYYRYILNGLMTQLFRIEKGKNMEEAHMRNRLLIARWVLEKGKSQQVVELKKREGKTFVVINDYPRLRELFGTLLAEVQRIKSEGDFAAGKRLVEEYGVRIDPSLHAEVVDRCAQIGLVPYKGFVNPVMHEVYDKQGEVIDITLDYTESYTEQMLRYSRDYSFLPIYND